ncbi:hypothetical protein DRO54_06920 [Candidatus Bathyarchaeota archaeon]|nr:MAG: hypothetical protein DRO54_06920 [Candidatus Bathyarchaeota archaeon]
MGEEEKVEAELEEKFEETAEIEAKNTKWILVVSLVVFIFTFYIATMTRYVYYYNYYIYPLIGKDFWYYLNLTNALFLILAITFSSLHLAEFGNNRINYKIAVYAFIMAMISLFVTFLRPLF